jgi:hypothetical protein
MTNKAQCDKNCTAVEHLAVLAGESIDLVVLVVVAAPEEVKILPVASVDPVVSEAAAMPEVKMRQSPVVAAVS